MDIIKGTEPNQGNEVQIVELGRGAQVLSGSSTAKIDGKTYLFTSPGRGGSFAWTFGADHKLTEAWKSDISGNTPFYANGLLYIYTVGQSPGLNVLEATTGKLVATLPAATGHWNSAIVVDNRIALPEGAISGFGGMGGRRGGGAPGAAPAAPAAEPIPAGIVNIWQLP